MSDAGKNSPDQGELSLKPPVETKSPLPNHLSAEKFESATFVVQSHVDDFTGKRYLTVDEVAMRFGVSRATIWRWTRRGYFPEPVRFSKRVTRWSISDLAAYEAQHGHGRAL